MNLCATRVCVHVAPVLFRMGKKMKSEVKESLAQDVLADAEKSREARILDRILEDIRSHSAIERKECEHPQVESVRPRLVLVR